MRAYSRYWVSPNLHYVLFASNIEPIWRHSFYATYSIYIIHDRRVMPFPKDKEVVTSRIRLASWSPSGSSLVFVAGNNLYYQASPLDRAVQITSSGDQVTLFNGVPDWLYEEEILSSGRAVWWSPDGRYLAYGTFNCSGVATVTVPIFSSDDKVKPRRFAYPKAGDKEHKNTRVTLYVHDLQEGNRSSVHILPPTVLRTQDHYLFQVSWLSPDRLLVVWANREQNCTYTTLCDIKQKNDQNVLRCVENIRLCAPKNGWIEPIPPVWPLPQGNEYLTVLPLAETKHEGERHAYRRVARISSTMDKSGLVNNLTAGDQEAKEILSYHHQSKTVYYTSTGGDPRKKLLYKKSEDKDPECLTCSDPGCSFVSASFSHSSAHYVLACEGPDVPTYWLKSTTNRNYSHLLEGNKHLNDSLSRKAMPEQRFHYIPIGGGQGAMVKILVPPAREFMVPRTTFPLVLNVYNGPSTQAVTLKFDLGFHTYLSSSEHVVVAWVDPRGSASRGENFKFMVNRRLADADLDDHLLTGIWLQTNVSYINAELPAAVMGWGYAGFLSAHILADRSDVFECAISGAPLVNMKNYATAGAERYMGLGDDEDSLKSYEHTDLVEKAGGMKHKQLLLVHGTADDKIHFSNAAELAKALNDEDVQFNFQMYPDENHVTPTQKPHLYKLYVQFLQQTCWMNQAYEFEKQRNARVIEKTVNIHGLPEEKLEKMRARQYFEKHKDKQELKLIES